MAAEAAEEAAVAAATASDAQKEINTGKAGGWQNADILSAACFLCI